MPSKAMKTKSYDKKKSHNKKGSRGLKRCSNSKKFQARSNRRWNRYILALFKDIDELNIMSISTKAIMICNNFLTEIANRILTTAKHLVEAQCRKTLTARKQATVCQSDLKQMSVCDLQTSYKLIAPIPLYLFGDNTGKRAMNKLNVKEYIGEIRTDADLLEEANNKTQTQIKVEEEPKKPKNKSKKPTKTMGKRTVFIEEEESGSEITGSDITGSDIASSSSSESIISESGTSSG